MARAAIDEWQVEVGADHTTALYERAENERATFIFAHGAGGHMRDRSMDTMAGVLHRCGVSTVRFNFLYREQGSRRPDPMPRLQACTTAVIERSRVAIAETPLIIGGRSMGGRVASMLAAEGTVCDGLLLFAYPLHAAGKPEKLRDAHLARIYVPVLCFNGTRDALCRRDLMENAISSAGSNWTMRWLEGADHSFHVLKRAGRSDDAVLEEVAAALERWLTQLSSSGNAARA